MEALGQTAMTAKSNSLEFMKTALNGEGCRRKQCPVLVLACGPCSTRPVASSQLYNALSTRRSVVSMARKSANDKQSHVPLPDESYGPFPEAMLLKKKDIQRTNEALPDFEDVNEEELLTSLELQLESAMDFKTTRHYEIMYLIHEDNADEVQEVVSKVKDFVEEKKGKIWRLNDWGMRRLAYKIEKAKKANYILMNIEMGAEHINDLKTLFDKDERVIRHLVMKQKKAITEDCPPPPEFNSSSTLTDEEDMDEGPDYVDELEDELEEELDEEFDDLESEGQEMKELAPR
jgi:ribosomal protein S6